MRAAARGTHPSACDEEPLESAGHGRGRERVRRGEMGVRVAFSLLYHNFLHNSYLLFFPLPCCTVFKTDSASRHILKVAELLMFISYFLLLFIE